MQRVLFAAFLIIMCATAAAAGPFEDAVSAYRAGDYAKAAQVFRSLAEQGDPRAQNNLGMMYADGRGVPQDDQEAVKWSRLAAKQGFTEAQYNLGVMYEEGRGLPQDYQQALMWYRKAAEEGNASAQNNLGGMYAEGRGVPQDFVRAHMWYSVSTVTLSGDNGQRATMNRDNLSSLMTASQLKKSQEMARRCQEIQFKECD